MFQFGIKPWEKKLLIYSAPIAENQLGRSITGQEPMFQIKNRSWWSMAGSNSNVQTAIDLLHPKVGENIITR